jgi:hypothetical protein
MRNNSNKRCGENPNTFHDQKYFFDNCAVYKVMWKNMVELDRSQMTIKYGTGKARSAYQITNVRIQTQTHSV